MEEIDLHRRKGFDVDVREAPFDLPHHLKVVLPFPVRMQSPGDMNLVNLRRQFMEDFVDGHLVCIRLPLLRGKVAKLTGEHTDVGRLDLLIEHKVHRVAAFPSLYLVRHLPEGDDVPRMKHRDTVLQRKTFTPLNFVPNGRKPGISKRNIVVHC